MIGSFIFNNISSEDFGLVTKSVSRPLLPAKKVNRVETPGASGAFDFGENEYAKGTGIYGLKTITMRIQYIGSDLFELRSKAREIAAWLSLEYWTWLEINDEPNLSHLAKVSSDVALENLFEYGWADIKFDCQPFAYSKKEINIYYTLSQGGGIGNYHEFINPGTKMIDYTCPNGAYFEMYITGEWQDLRLALNGKELYVNAPSNNASSYLMIDNVYMLARLDGENAFDKLSGDIDSFLRIRPGVNNLLVSSTGDLDIEIEFYFIPLWL